MAGLLSDVLPFLYSQGDRAKRHVRNLLSDPLGSLEQTAGGIQDAHRAQFGLLAQAFPDQRRPFKVGDDVALAQATQNMMNGPLGFAPAGITVWHGSPHIFDKFDSSKIGTGEGAQAYGHGIYLAEAPDVAKQYAGDLSAARATRPVGNVDLTEAYQNLASDVPESLLAARRDFRALQESGALSPADRKDFLAAVKNNIVGARGGNMYKVDLPDSAVAKMASLDSPIEQQPQAVQDYYKRLGILKPGKPLSEHVAIDKWAAEEFRNAGVPGLRYLDGGSRGAGKGSSNFVLFPGEENLLTILERNGSPLGK